MEHALRDIRRRSIDALDQAICRLSARMDAACYEQLVLIRELVEKALDLARDSLARDDAELAGESWSARQADALIAMARAYLGGEPSDRTRPYHQVTVHVDRSALIDGRGRSGLPIESVRRIACDSETVTIVEDENEQPLSVGRQSRTVPKRIQQALWARDKGCTFPGCRRTRFVDAHHVVHWADGGETSLDNLLLLCSRHHRAVHQRGLCDPQGLPGRLALLSTRRHRGTGVRLRR